MDTSNKRVFIYGSPGAGKTTYSLSLQKKLGSPLVEADYLREVVAQKEKTKEQDPFLYVGTKEAYRHFGKLNQENVIKGLGAVRNSMAPYVDREVSRYPDSLILEGAFLDPAILSTQGKLILLTTKDESAHRQQFFKNREVNEENTSSFSAARILQEYLLEEAARYPVEIIDSSTIASSM